MPGLRAIIRIDEDKCDGCGLCVPACEEGALRIVVGKARVVSVVHGDGLGACLGVCPRGARTIEEREAEAFDPAVVETHIAPAACPSTEFGGCPGSRAMRLTPDAPGAPPRPSERPGSRLGNWPVQLHLLPEAAPYLDGADLLLAADCTAFAVPDFHGRLLDGRVLVIGCPKLDDGQAYMGKLARILATNDVRSLTVAHMEVPCCHALPMLARQALERSGKTIPFRSVCVGIRGTVEESD